MREKTIPDIYYDEELSSSQKLKHIERPQEYTSMPQHYPGSDYVFQAPFHVVVILPFWMLSPGLPRIALVT